METREAQTTRDVDGTRDREKRRDGKGKVKEESKTGREREMGGATAPLVIWDNTLERKELAIERRHKRVTH